VTRSGRLIIVAGLPGAGKTTLACRLERELNAVRLSPDEWLATLDVDPFDGAARARVEALQWTVAQRLLELGAVVIIEWGTWSRAKRDGLRERARALGAAVELRFLDAEPHELWRRVQARAASRPAATRTITLMEMDAWAATIERPGEDELALFDPPA
jgi:predicted kinase